MPGMPQATSNSWRNIQDNFVNPRLRADEANEGASRLGAFNSIGNYGGFRFSPYQDVNYGGFDPTSYMQNASRASFNTLSEDMNRNFSRLGASNNARGLFGSGIGQANVMRDFNSRLADALAGHSMQAAGMAQRSGEFATDVGFRNRANVFDRDQARLGQLGNVAQMSTGMYQMDTERANTSRDMMYGTQANRVQQRYADEQAAKNRKYALAGALVGGISQVGAGMATGGTGFFRK